MGSSFVTKLAFNNIKQNRKFYLPYILASIGTMMMFYIMCFLAFNTGIDKMPGSAALSFIMAIGTVVVGLFSAIFLFYTNSFLIKRRKKEIGLYNILGMEKRHIAKILACESAMISVFSIVMGLLCGVLFSKLAYMILCKMVSFSNPIVFNISWKGIIITSILFTGIYLVSLISNLVSIKLAKPIELLNGSNVGEKEPKTKLLLAIIGAVCLGAGYYIAITTESPLKAIMLFFVAVILVIIGTYCLFTAGSIVILKALRKNKKFYYKPKNFTAVSGMIYRMKQNAVGLANICILSTMVLVMVSATVSLYLGTNDVLSTRFAGDISASKYYSTASEAYNSKVDKDVTAICDTAGRKMSDIRNYTYLSFCMERVNDTFTYDTKNEQSLALAQGATTFIVITADEYKKMTGKNESLKGNEVFVYNNRGNSISDSFTLFKTQYNVKSRVDQFMTIGSVEAYVTDAFYVVVANEKVLTNMYKEQLAAYGGNANSITREFAFNLDGTDKQKIAVYNKVDNYLANEKDNYIYYGSECRQVVAPEYNGMIGGFLFLGLFLGIVFTLAAAMIIYYKQISEGYYDKDKFEIMQKVGMSKSEVKKSIRAQVMMVFFVPLVMAGIHVLAAFNMITRLLSAFSLTNITLFAMCTFITFLIFAVIYALVYIVTAKEYYKIVESNI